MRQQPPPLLLRFLRWFCHPDLVKYIEGDLIELFEERVREKGVRKARWLFVWDVGKLFRPGIIRPAGGTYRMNLFGLLKNYLKVARRSLWKNKGFSAIHILGLSVSISVTLIIFTVIDHEYSYDQFHESPNRIYRVVSEFNFQGETFYNPGIAPALPNEMERNMPGLEKVAHLYRLHSEVKTAESDKKGLYQNDIIFTTKEYFDIFNYDWLAGSPETALSHPYNVVLSKSRSEQYFPSGNYDELIGKTIIYNDFKATITGIVDEFAENSDLIFKEFISFSSIESAGLAEKYQMNVFDFTNDNSQVYIKIDRWVNPENIKNKLAEIVQDHVGEEAQKLNLQPLADLHFNVNYHNYSGVANKKTLYALAGLAGFLLLLGGINYINLSTAQNITRAKEVGIRKTLGSTSRQLILLSVLESCILTSIATCIAVISLPTLVNIFSEFLPSDLVTGRIYQPSILLFFILIISVVGGISGVFPGLLLTRLKPMLALKSDFFNHKRKTFSYRSVLTSIQFVIAQAFIGITLVVVQQINYSIHLDPGFNKDNVISIRQPFDHEKRKSSVLLSRLQAIPDIEVISFGNNPPLDQSRSSKGFKFMKGAEIIETHVDTKYGDRHYPEVFQFDFLAGRNIGEGDSLKELLINQTYANNLGFPNPSDALGQVVELNESNYHIVGVISDFHMTSTREPIRPLAFLNPSESYHTVHLRLSDSILDNARVMEDLESIWAKVYPNTDFYYLLTNEKIRNFYRTEYETARLLKWITGMAVLISCLGLIGLSVFTINRRTKEIGIRKVLGISIHGIIYLLTWGSIRPIVVAILLAVPITWLIAQQWLETYAYRIDLNLWHMGFVGIPLALLSFLIITSLAIKIAHLNPVESLRDE